MKAILLRSFQGLVTVGVLVWVFHDPQLRANIPTVLRQAEPGWILLGVAFAGAGELANIFRWHIFLRMQKISIPLARTAMVFGGWPSSQRKRLGSANQTWPVAVSGWAKDLNARV